MRIAIGIDRLIYLLEDAQSQDAMEQSLVDEGPDVDVQAVWDFLTLGDVANVLNDS